MSGENSGNHTSNSAFYDRISRAYDLIADSSEHRYRQDGIAALELGEGDRVLEIGFGTGNGMLEIADQIGETGHVSGIDISQGMLDVATEKIEKRSLKSRISAQVASALSIPFEDSSFDAAFLSFTLELFADDEIPLVLSEIKRVLHPGGKLGDVSLATTPDGGHDSLMTLGYKWSHRHFPHIVDCRPIDATGVIRDAGFEIVVDERESMWNLPVAIVVGKKPE